MSFWFPIVQLQFLLQSKMVGFHLFRAMIINHHIAELFPAALECTLPAEIQNVRPVIGSRSGLKWVVV